MSPLALKQADKIVTPIAAGAVACDHAILDPRPLTLSPAVPFFFKKEADDDIPCTYQHFRCSALLSRRASTLYGSGPERSGAGAAQLF